MPSIDSLNIILKENKIPSVLLMFGEEDFLLDEDYDKLITKLLPNEEAKYDFEYIDATESDFNRIVDSCSSYPFVNTHRIVVLNNFDNLADKHSKKDNQDEVLNA